jgi:phosphate-selective porin
MQAELLKPSNCSASASKKMPKCQLPLPASLLPVLLLPVIALLCTTAWTLGYSSTASALPVSSKDDDLVIGTKDGFSIRTKDDKYGFKLNAFVLYDYLNYDNVLNAGTQDPMTFTEEYGSDDYAEVREARLILSGHTKDWHYHFSYDFADDGQVRDAYVRYQGFGNWAHLTFGRHKTPFSMDGLTSLDEITALERNIVSQAIWTGRQDGISISGSGERFSYRIGTYEAEDIGISSNEDTGSMQAMRFTGLPVLTRHGSFHIGFSYQSLNIKDELPDAPSSLNTYDVDSLQDGVSQGTTITGVLTATYDRIQALNAFNSEVRAEEISGGSGRRVDSLFWGAPIQYDGIRDIGIELAGTVGPVHIQFDYAKRKFENDLSPSDISGLTATGPTVEVNNIFDDREYDALSLQASWVITGERRSYDAEQGLYRSITPTRRGIGAWELYLRFSAIDTSEDWETPTAFINAANNMRVSNQGSNYESTTIGLNWYINSNMRLNLNFVSVDHEQYACTFRVTTSNIPVSPASGSSAVSGATSHDLNVANCSELNPDGNSGDSIGLRFQYSY